MPVAEAQDGKSIKRVKLTEAELREREAEQKALADAAKLSGSGGGTSAGNKNVQQTDQKNDQQQQAKQKNDVVKKEEKMEIDQQAPTIGWVSSFWAKNTIDSKKVKKNMTKWIS